MNRTCTDHNDTLGSAHSLADLVHRNGESAKSMFQKTVYNMSLRRLSLCDKAKMPVVIRTIIYVTDGQETERGRQRWRGEKDGWVGGGGGGDGRKRGFDQREREREREIASIFIGFKTLARIRIFSV